MENGFEINGEWLAGGEFSHIQNIMEQRMAARLGVLLVLYEAMEGSLARLFGQDEFVDISEMSDVEAMDTLSYWVNLGMIEVTTEERVARKRGAKRAAKRTRKEEFFRLSGPGVQLCEKISWEMHSVNPLNPDQKFEQGEGGFFTSLGGGDGRIPCA